MLIFYSICSFSRLEISYCIRAALLLHVYILPSSERTRSSKYMSKLRRRGQCPQILPLQWTRRRIRQMLSLATHQICSRTLNVISSCCEHVETIMQGGEEIKEKKKPMWKWKKKTLNFLPYDFLQPWRNSSMRETHLEAVHFVRSNHLLTRSLFPTIQECASTDEWTSQLLCFFWFSVQIWYFSAIWHQHRCPICMNSEPK